jgi:hypothetical protein
MTWKVAIKTLPDMTLDPLVFARTTVVTDGEFGAFALDVSAFSTGEADFVGRRVHPVPVTGLSSYKDFRSS